jgi:hypothetical protein
MRDGDWLGWPGILFLSCPSLTSAWDFDNFDIYIPSDTAVLYMSPHDGACRQIELKLAQAQEITAWPEEEMMSACRGKPSDRGLPLFATDHHHNKPSGAHNFRAVWSPYLTASGCSFR